MPIHGRVTKLSIAIAGEDPPHEFRIFTKGKVETSKGEFLFDESAAASVMAEVETHGIDLMIDYDHASLASLSLDPALAGKAAGWFNLQVRNGELWAVNVRWTEPAAEALRRKEWRFMSPAFSTEEGRITCLWNVALTNMPATRRLEPLMAASAGGGEKMSIEEFLKVAKALGLDMTMSMDDAMAKIKGDSKAEEEPGTTDVVDEFGNTDPPPMAAAAPPPAPEQQAAVVAASARLMRLTGAESYSDAVTEVEVWRLSHLRLESETAKLAAERQALELQKRKENAITLTKLGAETPHTSGLGDGKLCKRLLEEPLAEQTARVAALLAARGGKLPSSPVVSTSGASGLDERQLAICKETNCDPATFARLKARRAPTEAT